MRQAIEVLRYVNMTTTCLIALACLYQWRKHKGAAARWAAIAFGTISIITIAGLFIRRDPSEELHGLYVNALLAVLVLFPYFLFRFTASFERPGRMLRLLVDGSTLIIVTATFALPGLPAEGAPRPIEWKLFLGAVMAQWTFLFVVVGTKLWRAGKGQPTVPRRRMRMLAIATMGLNLGVILGQAVGPSEVSAARLGLRFLSLGSASMLFIGLAPPAWLLHLWRRAETVKLQAVMGQLLGARTLSELSDILLPPTVGFIGARGACLLSNTGEVMGSYGETDESENTRAHVINMRSGKLVIYTNAYTPFFGQGELLMAEGMGSFANLAMERFVLADSQRESEEALAYQARHDMLTGLPNRAMFLNRLAHSLDRVRRSAQGSVTVQFLDLDRFKVVNDGIDHAAGDALLVAVAKRLTASCREQDLVARFGGDEFVVLAEVADAEEALGLAGRLVAGLAAPFTIAGRELNITASVGVVVTDNASEPDAVVRDADTAMYRAKESGRACVVLFDDELRHQSVERLELERALRTAVTDGSLELHYQPMVRLTDSAVVGVEALFRWEHPRFGLMHADALIKLAEESDLIGQLGEWVLTTACSQAAEWRRTLPGMPDLKVWINVSPAQFMYRDVATDVELAMREAGIDESCIGIEITETVFVEETKKVRESFAALRELGIEVAIDDFGTGYSSLGALKRFPVNVLKVDGSFVTGLGKDDQDTAIVTACIALGSAMGLSVIAESVESDAQRRQLAAMGCAIGQGYFFSPPLTAGAASEYLSAHCAAREDAEPQPTTKPVLTLVLPDAPSAAVV